MKDNWAAHFDDWSATKIAKYDFTDVYRKQVAQAFW